MRYLMVSFIIRSSTAIVKYLAIPLTPEDAFLQLLLNILVDLWVADLDKAVDTGGIVVDELVAKVENIHDLPQEDSAGSPISIQVK